jgi:hypothetical protein
VPDVRRYGRQQRQAQRHRDHLVAWDGRRRGEKTTRSRARPVRPP